MHTSPPLTRASPPARASSPEPVLPRRAIAVLLSRFPLVTETFILREVEELERQGQPVRLVPLQREYPAVVHHEAQAWLSRALFTGFVSPAILAANVRAFARRPSRYVRLFGRVVLGSLRSVNVLVRTMALFPKCVYLAERLEREGIRHVHAHYATHPATAALIISSLAPITFSFTAHAHDLFVGWRRPLLRLKVRRATFIRVISAFNKTYLRALYPESAGKMRVIHVGIDPYRHRPWQSRSPSGHDPRLLCVAALQPYKGIPVLIAACARLSAAGFRFQCDIVGDGWLRPSLEDAIARAGLSDRVRLRGALRQDEVAPLLQQAAIVLLPSVVAGDGQMDGIPVALMEAMAAEQPVIASAISGIPELIDHAVNGLLVEPGNAAALADAIAALLVNPERAREMGLRGREKILRAFQLDACTTHLLRELDQWNPAPAPAEGLGDLAAQAGFTGHHLGVRRGQGGRDSTVVEFFAANGWRVNELILKTHKTRPGESRTAPARAAHEYNALALLEHRFPNGNVNGNEIALRTPRAFALRTSDASLVMERCGGDRLDELIRRGRRDPAGEAGTSLERAVERAGQWLRRLHVVTSRRDSGATSRAWDALVEDALNDLSAIQGRSVSVREAASIHRRLEELRPRLPSQAHLVGCHGDLSPGNIFVSAESLAAIDFEGFHEGLQWEDAGYFLVHVDLYLAYPGRGALRARLRQAFLAGSGVPADPAALELCRTVAAVKALARIRAPSWRLWPQVRLLRRTASGRGDW